MNRQYRMWIFVLALLISLPALGWAEGQREGVDVTESGVYEQDSDHDHHDDHDGEVLPHVGPLVGAGERLEIVATTSIVGDVLGNIAGDAAAITTLVPRGWNPHSYEPSPSGLRALGDADLVFINGLRLEEGLLGDLESVTGGVIVPVSAGIDVLQGIDHNKDEHGEDKHHDEDGHDGHDHAMDDPHVWMDPNNVIVWVENMVEILSAADPANAELYRENGDAYITELRTVDEFIRQQVATLPVERRKLVLDHEAISYFAEEYGFETIGTIVPGTSDRAEPSAQEVARLVNVVRDENVSAIFVSHTASRSLAQLADTVAREVGREVEIVPLLTGSLTEAGGEGDTYLAFLSYNVAQILAALGD